MRDWHEIEPKDATEIKLPHPDIRGPLNELGEPCPWPWEPQQLGGAPMGQYHCGYCGGMQMAGMPHLDWTGACEACRGGPSGPCVDPACTFGRREEVE